MNSSTSAIVNRSLRTHVIPKLRQAGFDKVDARNGWAWRDDIVLVFSVRAVGRYFADVTGWSPGSVGVWLGVRFSYATAPEGLKISSDGLPLPAEHQCHMRGHLERTIEQPEGLAALRNPAETRRSDLWWINPDGSNAEAVAVNIADQFETVAIKWYETNSDPEAALVLVEQERDCFNKFVLAAYLAEHLGLPEKHRHYKRLSEAEGKRIGIEADPRLWFRLPGR